MFLSHGVGEYTGRYENLAKFLSRHGVLVVGHDHGEHGFALVYISTPHSADCQVRKDRNIHVQVTLIT